MGGRAVGWALAGGGAFTLAAWAAGRAVPGYSHSDEPISALAARGVPSSPVMAAGFVGLATGTAGLAWSLRGAPKAPPPVPALLAAASATTLGAGMARCSSRSCPSRFLGDDDAAAQDELHGACSMATFLLWITAPLVASRRASTAAPWFRVASSVLGIGALSALLAGAVRTRRPPAGGVGTAQRAMVATILAWFLLAAG